MAGNSRNPIFALRKQKAKMLNVEGDLVAQLVEQYTFNVWALGSSPSQITVNRITMLILSELSFFCCYWYNISKLLFSS